MDKWDRLLDVYAEVGSDSAWDNLRRPGINFVPGDGAETSETASILIVGEAPGAQENGAHRPFTGPSGLMLNRLLESIGLSRALTFVTNVVKYRPPGNRTPTTREIILGQKTLRREWKIIHPILTMAVGTTAQKALSQTRPLHGVPCPFGGGDGLIVSVYHPAFGLRQPKAQEWIEQEWSRLGHELELIGVKL
jgi:uracil-DNA glycosylase